MQSVRWWHGIARRMASQTEISGQGGGFPFRNQPLRVHDQRESRSLGKSAMVWHGERWAPPGPFAQVILLMNVYIFDFQPRYMERSGQLHSCAVKLWRHPVMGLMTRMMITTNHKTCSIIADSFSMNCKKTCNHSQWLIHKISDTFDQLCVILTFPHFRYTRH